MSTRPRPLYAHQYEQSALTWGERIAFVALVLGSVIFASAVVGGTVWATWNLLQRIFG